MKKNNQWQKPDLSVMVRNSKNTGTYKSDKKLYGLGVPPMPMPSYSVSKEVDGVGVPPMPTPPAAMS